ncbi:MAG: DNA-binding transcriptional regulator [Micrococcales bacterium 70-64]|nr:WYL domain-containing protein [Leifsonia sp.]ODU64888.1 MAG: DNA-binding transcriptional regulator [Leifsonia sp. SCN 70-46]OJX86580.1 MAG: DNA-binding transcriptional regulator [Micrococcales bacterium 70-64]
MRNDPTGRALQLLSLLQTQRFWQAGELAARLEVTGRTVRRDVERLRELGYAVDTTTGKYGGYRLASGSHLPPLVLDDEEAVAIAVGLRYAAVAAIDGIEETSVRALSKIEALLPHRLRRRVSALHTSVTSTRRREDGDLVDPETLTVLAAACRDSEHVRFDYRRDDDGGSGRRVEPHELVTSGHRWYLVAWDRDRDDWRTFRVDRVRDPRPVATHFDPREIPGGAAAFVAAALGPALRRQDATLTIHADYADLAAVLRWIDHTPVAAGPHSCTVRIHGEDLGRLAMSVARIALCAPVDVVEPGTLASAVAQLSHNLAGRTS